jgi:cell division protein FtsW
MENLLRRTKGDPLIWCVIVLLSLISVMAVYSATGSLAYRVQQGHTEYYLLKQLSVLAFGLTIIYLSHKVNYTIYSRLAVFMFLISIPLLIYTLFFGTTLNEGSRWVRLPGIGITFQSSDFAKLALFMFLARQLSKKQHVIKDLKKGFLPIVIPVIVICGLIAPANLSTALMIGLTSMIMFFIGRVNTKHLAMLVVAGIFGVGIIFGISKLTGFGRADTWEQRIKDFAGGGDHEEPYQVTQAKIAIANGGITGLGPGNSRQRNFLPHPYSDFIYSIIIEEYGLMGGCALIMLYLLFMWRSIRIFKKCPYAFGAFLAVGLSFTLVFQAMLNMAVNVHLVPVTGLTLPMVSMGGSSIWFTSFALGIILSVSRYVEDNEGSGDNEHATAAS